MYVTVTTSTGEVVQQENKDEIKLFLKGRYMSSMDAMWRVLNFHTYPSSTPSVTTIKIKTPSDLDELMADGMSCSMLVYFCRPEALRNYKYTDMYKLFLSGTCPHVCTHITPFIDRSSS